MRLWIKICLIFLVESYATNDDCCEPNRGECIEEDTYKFCLCFDGYHGDRCQHPIMTSISLNDRQNEENPCDFAYCGENSVCTPCLDDLCNDEITFQCSCKPGFENFEIGSNICIDINECMQPESRCQENAECVNAKGSYSCACKEGFYEDENGNCQDYDECSHDRTDQSTGVSVKVCDKYIENLINAKTSCENTVGSFYCSWHCLPGFREESEGHCVPKCNPKCDESQECVDVKLPFGTIYSCECKDGFVPKQDTPGCEQVSVCSGLSCGENEVCEAKTTKTAGGWTTTAACVCSEGFERLDDDSDCVEKLVDECEELSDCSRDAECVNFPGGHTCICNEGFHGDGHECFDTNECISEELSHSCEEPEICVNTIGSYKCLVDPNLQCYGPDEEFCEYNCRPGYSRSNGDFCTDIDECDIGSIIFCGPNSICRNTLGSYSCDCKYGFQKVGDTCERIHPCELGTHDCGNSHCMEEPDFKWRCEMKNYCMEENIFCDENQHCINDATHGVCVCDIGFKPMALHPEAKYEVLICVKSNYCDEFNDCSHEDEECSLSDNVCEPICPTGFIKSYWGGCEDINECMISEVLSGKQSCGDGELCINTPGSYKCEKLIADPCAVTSGESGQCPSFTDCWLKTFRKYADENDNGFIFSKKSKNELVPLTSFPPSNKNKERISITCKDGYLNGNDGRLKSHQLICSCNQHFCDWNWFQGQPKKCLDPTCEPVKYIKWGKYVQVRIAGKNGVHLETRFLHKQSSWPRRTRKTEWEDGWTIFLLVPKAMIIDPKIFKLRASSLEADFVGAHVEDDGSTTILQFQSTDFHGNNTFTMPKKYHKIRFDFRWFAEEFKSFDEAKNYFKNSRIGWIQDHHKDLSFCAAEYHPEAPPGRTKFSKEYVDN